MTLYEKISLLCKEQGFSVSNIGEIIPGLNVTKGSVTGWKHGAKPRSDKIKIIADYFNVTVEYLVTDSITVPQTIHDNHGVIGGSNENITINNGADEPLGEIERELLRLCGKMDMKKKNALLMKAYELSEE